MKKEVEIAIYVGIAFLIIIVSIAILIPCPTKFQYLVFKTIIAIAISGFASTIPGFFKIRIRTIIRASGAIGIFIMVYFYNPADIIIEDECLKNIRNTTENDELNNINSDKFIKYLSIPDLNYKISNFKFNQTNEMLNLNFYSEKWNIKIFFEVPSEIEVKVLKNAIIEHFELKKYLQITRNGPLEIEWEITSNYNIIEESIPVWQRNSKGFQNIIRYKSSRLKDVGIQNNDILRLKISVSLVSNYLAPPDTSTT